MPGKSRKQKGKHKQLSRSKKGRQSPQVAVSQQGITTRAEGTAVIIPEAAVSPPAAKTLLVPRNPELLSELRRIGIFAGIVLSALILLAIVMG
jgi:hypothetical protein